MVLHSALVYDDHLYVYLRELGGTQYRRTSAAFVLYGWNHRLELLCGLFDQNIDRVPGQRQYLWEGLFSAIDHALEHCGE